MGEHNAEDPAGFPGEMWANPDVKDAASAFWDGAVDYVEDGKLSESARDRMVRSLRTLAQGVGAAVVTGAVPVAVSALKGHPGDVKGAVTAFGTAALAAVVAFFHTRK